MHEPCSARCSMIPCVRLAKLVPTRQPGSHGGAVPDPNTFEMLPWGDPKAPEARVFCDIHHLDGAAFGGDPRQVLKRNLARTRDQGYDFFIAPDMEFFYFEPPQPGQTPGSCAASARPSAPAWWPMADSPFIPGTYISRTI